jgi:mannose-6-phosphate isomerase class I
LVQPIGSSIDELKFGNPSSSQITCGWCKSTAVPSAVLYPQSEQYDALVDNMHRSFQPQLPVKASSDRAIHCQNEQPTFKWMSLEAGLEQPAVWNEDVAIVILEGKGCLCFEQEVVMLEPGMFVFIPAHNLYELKAFTQLVFLMDCFELNSSDTMNSLWIINL